MGALQTPDLIMILIIIYGGLWNDQGVDARDGPHGDRFGEREMARDHNRLYAMLCLLCYSGIMYVMCARLNV